MRNINKVLFNGAGFTLLEIVIVVTILGVMAGLAIPGYTNQMEQSRANEAQVNLNTIYLAEKIYRVNNGTYWAGGANPTIAAINTNLSIDPATPEFYPITGIVAGGAGIATSFTATATRNGGGWNGRSASIDETGAYTPP